MPPPPRKVRRKEPLPFDSQELAAGEIVILNTALGISYESNEGDRVMTDGVITFIVTPEQFDEEYEDVP